MDWQCANCGKVAEGTTKPCDCITGVGYRKGANGLEHIVFDSPNYRRLETGEVIQDGDECDVCNDGWRDEPDWRQTTCIGELAPDPSFPAHRQYRRKINQ